MKHNVLRIIILLTVVIVCIVALAVGIYTQFFYKYVDTDLFMLGKVDAEMVTQEMYTTLKNNFSKIFTNAVTVGKNVGTYSKIDTAKNIVYARESVRAKRKTI